MISTSHTHRECIAIERDRQVVDGGDLGLIDRWNRRITFRAVTWTETLSESRPGGRSNRYTARAAGEWFVFTPDACRNGSPYGAMQKHQFFATAEERDAKVAAYLADAAKRARKNPKFTSSPLVSR